MFVVLVMMTYHYQPLILNLNQKQLKVFKTKTINIRNDVEQWCDVIGVSQTGGSSKETSTIVPQYNIQKNNDIVKSKINFIPMTIFTQTIGTVIQLNSML